MPYRVALGDGRLASDAVFDFAAPIWTCALPQDFARFPASMSAKLLTFSVGANTFRGFSRKHPKSIALRMLVPTFQKSTPTPDLVLLSISWRIGLKMLDTRIRAWTLAWGGLAERMLPDQDLASVSVSTTLDRSGGKPNACSARNKLGERCI